MSDAPDPHTPPVHAPLSRRARILLVIAAGIVGAAIFGVTNLLVSVRDSTTDDVAAGVTIGIAVWFALIGAGFGAVLAWALLFGRRRPQARAAAAKDSIERSLQQRAASGAFIDVMIVSGVANLATALLDLDWTATAALGLITTVGLLDFTARYLTLQRREA